MSLTTKEKDTLKKLAEDYMKIATLKIQKEKAELWKCLNRQKMQRPMVVIDQLPWTELSQMDDSLACVISKGFWHDVEDNLRKSIYKWKHFPVDMVLEPFINIPLAVKTTGYGVGAHVELIKPYEGSEAPSQKYINAMKTFEDINCIKDIDVVFDKADSDKRMQQAQEIFDGLAPVVTGDKITGQYGFNLGIWDFLTTLMSIEEAYFALMDEPDFVHACLDRLTEATIAGIKKGNELKLHYDNGNTCHCSYIYTDELLPGFQQGKGPVSKNCWAFGLAQLFTGISPDMMAEFEIPYVSRMAEYFGMIYYGCCDRLDDRLDLVKKIPNVRKVSCSPWSNRKNFAEKIGSEIIMSSKPSPALIAGESVNWDEVRKDLQYSVDLAKANNVNLEIILKDISTVRFDPSRLTKWAETAMRIVEGN